MVVVMNVLGVLVVLVVLVDAGEIVVWTVIRFVIMVVTGVPMFVRAVLVNALETVIQPAILLVLVHVYRRVQVFVIRRVLLHVAITVM
jgi:hypothetical protein